MPGIELASNASQASHTCSSRERRRGVPVCVLDDDGALVAATVELLERLGFPASGTTEPGEALANVRLRRCRAVVSDVRMPSVSGLEFMDQALKLDPTLDVLLMTGFYSIDDAIEAIRRGARDYLIKPLEVPRLERTLDEIAEHQARRRRVQELEETLLQELCHHGMVGRSPLLLEMVELMRKAAPHFKNLLVSGPTGAGKELVARAMHQMSPAAAQPFAVCNCAALVESLLESQLFGQVRGAFTGATETRNGLFEFAHGGTVFLDEVGEMSPGLQAKVLRVIESREIQRLGSPEIRRVDVRLVAATNRNLRAEVVAGRFREDLYYRLSMLELRVPALADRIGDVPLLAQHFLKRLNQANGRPIEGFTRRAMARMVRYPWPGNVRELENAISSACITARAQMIDVDDLPEGLRRSTSDPGTEERRRPLTLDEVRREHIERVLNTCQGNRLRAARMLGIGRTSLYRFLKRHGGQKEGAASRPRRAEKHAERGGSAKSS
jgi:two-component system response regulator HydG